jgi:dihydrofolate reductase
MKAKNSVFIATSLDGYIADKNGGIDWLHSIPNPDNDDMGYTSFIKDIDAIIMGRNTFETVCRFDVDWPYQIPVFVISNSLKQIPEDYAEKAYLINGTLSEILEQIHKRGFHRLYIDGGATFQSFLKEDLIDEMIITNIPILLGGGFPLFSELPDIMKFDLISSKVYLDQITQNHYRRRR